MPANLNDYFNKQKENANGNNSFKKPEFNLKKPNLGKFSGLLYALIVIIALLVIARPFTIIQSGQVGILATAGKFEPNPLQPGLHFFIPLLQEVLVIDTKVRIINYSSNEASGDINVRGSGIIQKSSVSVLDSRNLPVSIDVTVQYRLSAPNAPQTISAWGLSWENKIIDPVVRDVVRSVVGKFTAEELPSQRENIADQLNKEIRSYIENLPNKPVELLAVQLREIILPPKVKEQIERVQIAKQEAERTKYEVERANQEALKKAALAKGTAEAIKIEAKGKADAVKIAADSQAYANKEIAKSLDNNLLKLKQIETQAKFNEALRENTDAKIFLTPGGAVPNIWVDTKDKAKQSAINSN